MPEEKQIAAKKKHKAADKKSPPSETTDSETTDAETVSQKAGRYERAARQQRLQEAKASLEARAALQGRITGVAVALILMGAIALSVHGCGR